MQIVIKNFSPSFANAVHEIERECFAHPWTVKNIIETASNGHSIFLMAVADGKCVGYGSLDMADGIGYFNNVAVSPAFRGNHIGEMLVRSLCENAKNNFCGETTLEVRQSNLPAIGLYEKCGFKKVGVRPNFYSAPAEDAVIMTRINS